MSERGASSFHRSAFWLCALLAGCVAVYWPGLSGIFLFDDWSNLKLLGQHGPIDNLEQLTIYLLSGFSGPTGRPISHLSFLIDAQDWPADPWPFKRTNLVIHLLCGVVLYAVLRQVAQALGRNAATASKVAVLAAAVWLLHPFWVSTTLYAVQRMTQLSALFVLLGLWLYLYGRLRFPPVLSLRWALLSASAIGVCGVLAVFSKENGALLPLLALVLEATVLRAHDLRLGRTASRGFKVWRWLLLGVPALLVFAYLLQRGVPALLAGEYAARGFTPEERLMTQARVMWDYVFNLVLPRLQYGGLFHDDFVISRGLFQPWSTFIALVAGGGVLAWAWLKRARYPAVALVVLFFAAGHVLESTLIPLELYFEHRNYLPAVFIGLLPALWVFSDGGEEQRLSKTLVAVSLVAVLMLCTALHANQWGSPFEQARKWVKQHPDSPRALMHLASFWRETGNQAEASRLNARVLELRPNGLTVQVILMIGRCDRGENVTNELANFVNLVESDRSSNSIKVVQVSRFYDRLLEGGCSGAETSAVLESIHFLQKNTSSRSSEFMAMLKQREAAAWLSLGRPEQAQEAFAKMLELSPSEPKRMRSVAVLATAGHYREALELLELPLEKGLATGLSITALKARYMERVGYYARERDRLREVLRADIEATERAASSGGA